MPEVLELDAQDVTLGDHVEEGRQVVEYYWTQDDVTLVVATVGVEVDRLDEAGRLRLVHLERESTLYGHHDKVRVLRGIPQPLPRKIVTLEVKADRVSFRRDWADV